MVRKHLKQLCDLLGLPRHYTFHDFRRGGAIWAFTHGVPFQVIQAQGIYNYLLLSCPLWPLLFLLIYICNYFYQVTFGIWVFSGPGVHFAAGVLSHFHGLLP